MSQNQRTKMLSAIRRGLGRGPLSVQSAEALEARASAGRPGPIPARGQLPDGERRALFIRLAKAVDADVHEVASVAAVPAAVTGLLRQLDLPPRLRIAPHPALRGLAWDDEGLSATAGRAEADDLVALSMAYAAVAESGTLVMASGPQSPITLSFLPDTHIVVVAAEDIVASYEDVWARMRRERRDGLRTTLMPRSVNWITGPSRTADIEQTLQLGVHGPRRLFILVAGGSGGG